jgi:tRNA threonylcarbamoyladenosine biosynthesis protein TsaE
MAASVVAHGAQNHAAIHSEFGVDSDFGFRNSDFSVQLSPCRAHCLPDNAFRSVIHLSDSPDQTHALAAALARTFRGGECVALEGELGAGKTQFVRGLLRGLGGNPRTVSSPTFMLLNVYDTGRLRLFHLDAYRVTGAEDFESIGFCELLDQGGVVVVEWASRVRELLSGNCIDVRIETIDENRRNIQISDHRGEPRGDK